MFYLKFFITLNDLIVLFLDECLQFIIIFEVVIYLTAPGLSSSLWDLHSSLRHMGSLEVAFELLVIAHGI